MNPQPPNPDASTLHWVTWRDYYETNYDQRGTMIKTVGVGSIARCLHILSKPNLCEFIFLIIISIAYHSLCSKFTLDNWKNVLYYLYIWKCIPKLSLLEDVSKIGIKVKYELQNIMKTMDFSHKKQQNKDILAYLCVKI